MALLAGLAGKAGSAVGELGGQLLGLKTTGDLFIGILQSRTVEDELIPDRTCGKFMAPALEDARKELRQHTNISRIAIAGSSPSRLLTESAERRESRQLYVAELNQVVNDLNTSSAHKERVFLAERLDEVKQRLESAEKDFSQFASKNTAIDIQEQGKAMLQAGAALEGELIATQTELEGLRQLYTDNNIRVRETQARLDELRRQLQKISGNAGAGSGKADDDPSSPYPSMRRLPLLGVRYADLYRRMKIQEAVFDTLTQQYELARVEEAKETPSVQVLDPADVPDQKSYPQRWIIVLVGTLMSFAFGVVWILGDQSWEVLDPTDPRKLLALEVFHTAKAVFPWARKNGFHAGDGNHAD